RARWLHAARSRGRAWVDRAGRLQAGARARATCPRPARGPTRHLPRLGSWPRTGRDTRRNRVRGAVVPHGARPLGAVPQVRWARWMQALFYGIGAAVIAIIAWSAARLARTTLGRDRLLWGLFAVSLAVTAWTAREIIWLFVASGFIPLLARPRARPSLTSKALLVAPWPGWLTSGLAGAASVGLLWKVFGYFGAAGL